MTWNNLWCILPIQKVLKSNPYSSVTLTPNLNKSFTTLWNFFGDASICKQDTCQLLRIFPNFLPQSPHMISWYHDKSHDFQSSFAFYRIWKQSSHMFVVMFCEQDIWIFLWILRQCFRLDSITWISFFHSLYYIIRSTCSSNLNIPKVSF